MKLVSPLISIIFFLLLLSACGSKKKDNKEKFFPVLSFIQSQVKQVDTSLYSIRKIIFHDSLKYDTLYIPREEFRNEAQDFLTLPDLAAAKYSERYKETEDFDPELNRVLIVYLPINPEKEEIQRQEVLIKPGDASLQEDKVTNIIVNRVINTKDSSVQKRMLWNIDKSFQVTTIRQLKNEEEKISTYKIIWNEDTQE